MSAKEPLSARLISFGKRLTRALLDETKRTRREIVAPAARPRGERPIFVIGVHRSGTTLVRLILDSHSRIACPPESFFLLPESRLLEDRKALEGLQAMGFARDHVVARAREHAAYFFEMYAASHQKPRWADKTPSYVDCLDFIETVFGPDCQYVFVYRHGLDSACSIARIPDIAEAEPHVAVCGGDRFAGAARYWATQCGVMRAFAARHPGRVLELFYEKLVADPEAEARRLFAFLGEPWEPQVLRFHEQPHDHWAGLQDVKASSSKGFVPNVERWREEPPERIAAMLAQAGERMRELGYEAGARP
ncbi:MAG TPA: sulfotransferase [Myxococcota bacterium]|nr:sulfotransferase [Myxococcota bacterium]